MAWHICLKEEKCRCWLRHYFRYRRLFCQSEGIGPNFFKLIWVILAFERFSVLLKNDIVLLDRKDKENDTVCRRIELKSKTVQVHGMFPSSFTCSSAKLCLVQIYLLSPTWQYTDFRMVDWSCLSRNAILHPHENCSHFHLSVVNRKSYCVFPAVPNTDRHTRPVYPPVIDAIIKAIHFDDPFFGPFKYLPSAWLKYAAMPLTLREKACRVIVSELQLSPPLSVSYTFLSLSQHPLLQ